MPKYRVTGPDGATYEVNAPEGATEQDVMAYVQKNAGQPEAPDNRSFGEKAFKTVDDVVRSVASGATFGFADEIAAGANSLVGDQSYDDALKAERARDASIPGYIRVPGEIGGMVAGTVATGGAAALPRAATLGGRVAQGAGTGAALGGVYGFGSGEGGVEGRIANAIPSGLLGGAVGGAAPAVGAGARNLAERLMTGTAARGAGLSRPAYQVLNRAMSADDSFTGAGERRIYMGGDDAMLADAGPNAMSLLDTAVQRSGPAATAARNAVEGRAGRAADTVTKALDEGLGRPGESTSRALVVYGDKTSPLTRIYQAAYEKPIDYASEVGRRIEDLVLNRVPAAAIRRANDLMRIEGEQSKQILANIADDGTVTYRRMPDVRQLDYITRALNDVADQANGQGVMGGTTQLGRAYANLSRDIRGAVKEAVPEYKKALDAAAGMIRESKAREFGATVLSPRTTRDEVKTMLSGMGDAEKRKVAEGIRLQIDDALANVKRAMTDGNMDAREALKALKDLSSRASREKIETVIGQQQAARLFNALDQATTAFEMRAGVAANSRTFARTQMDDTIRAITDEGPMNALRSGQPVNAGQRMVQNLLGRTPADKARIADETYSELVNALTGPRGPQAQALLQRLVQAEAMLPPRAEGYGRLAEMLMRRNPVVTAPVLEGIRR